MFLPHWTNGRDTAIDVTVVSSLQQALVDRAAASPGAALVHAQSRKDTHSKDDCDAEGIEFCALPIEVLGGFSQKSVEIVSKLARQLARQTSQEESEVVAHVFQRLSVYLMKGNSSLLIKRIPHEQYPPQTVDGVL